MYKTGHNPTERLADIQTGSREIESFKGYTGTYLLGEKVKNQFGATGINIEIDNDATIDIWARFEFDKNFQSEFDKAYITAEMICKAGELAQKYGSLEEMEYQREHFKQLAGKLAIQSLEGIRTALKAMDYSEEAIETCLKRHQLEQETLTALEIYK